jgi:hypothetical protein
MKLLSTLSYFPRIVEARTETNDCATSLDAALTTTEYTTVQHDFWAVSF